MAEAQLQQDTQADSSVETRSRSKDFRKAFFSNRLAIFGTVIMAIFIIMAVFAPARGLRSAGPEPPRKV